MAANRFATMLHRNTNRITVILVYAVLEWVLIILLLLNSQFSYLIRKFANFFGLKPPCLWCTRVDHIWEPSKNAHSYRDLVCEAHAAEISRLGYCSNHKKLADLQNMCQDCSPPHLNIYGKSTGISQKIAFFSWLSENTVENGENYRCSCCNESLSSKLYPPYLFFKPSWGVPNYTQKGTLIVEHIEDDENEDGSDPRKSISLADNRISDFEIHPNKEDENDDDERAADEHYTVSDVGSFSFKEVAEEDCLLSVSNFQCDEMELHEDEKVKILKILEHDQRGWNFVHHQSSGCSEFQVCSRDDESLKFISLCCQNCIECDFNRTIPLEVIDFSTQLDKKPCKFSEENLGKQDHQEGTKDFESQIETQVPSIVEIISVSGEASLPDATPEKTWSLKPESMEVGKAEKYLTQNAEDGKGNIVDNACKQVENTLTAPGRFPDDCNIEEATVDPQETEEEEEGLQTSGKETKSLILLGTEMFNQESTDQVPAHGSITSLPYQQEEQSSISKVTAETSTNPDEFVVTNDKVATGKASSREGMKHHSSFCLDTNEVKEERCPDTPTSMESLHYIQKKLSLLEKRDWGMDESLDGSVASEMEGGDGVHTIERLKSALKAERKALSALYAELEEERSATAIATNQTMAMITRLQEEKAAMQMEALQYQRMMEEQSEYDQEALQFLNELMVKREKEKQELERELEIYRKRVLDYEAREKVGQIKRRKDSIGRSRTPSASCSNTEESDELSIDLNTEPREEDTVFRDHQGSSNSNTPVHAVLDTEETELDCVKHLSTLDESLEEFDQERLSILEQLKALEEKIFMLGVDEEQFFEDVKPLEHLSDHMEIACNENYDLSSQEKNEVSNGFPENLRIEQYPQRTMMDSNAKRFLPFFDAVGIENEEGRLIEEQVDSDFVGMQDSLISRFDMENKKLAIEEEVDHICERLQALEADREFLKHCISSLKKGDKGIDLLQEILQHLRDLRSVELRAKNMGDGHIE